MKKILKKYNDIPIAGKATLWFVFCSTLQKCISLITTPIFTRLMTTEQYGQFGVYNSWLQIFTIITTFRLNYSVFNKGMSKYREDRDAYTSTMQTLTFVITLISLMIYLVFREPINNLIELPTFVMIAMFIELLVFPAVEFWTIRKRYEYIYKPVVFRTLLMTVLNAVVGVVAVLLADEKGYARILSCIAVNFAFGMALFVYNLHKGKKMFVWEYAKFALLFNLPLIPHYFSQYMLDQFDRIMIQKLVGVAEAGIYTVAYNAGLMMKIVTQSLNNALVPWQYGKLEKKDLKSIDTNMFFIYIVIGVISFLFSLCAPEIMRIFADERYYGAVYVIPPIALSMFFMFMYNTFGNVEFFFEKKKFTMYVSIGCAAIKVLLNFICIKAFGYIAAAYTTLFCYILFAAAHYIYMTVSVRKELNTKNVFDTKRIVLLSAVLVFFGLIVVLLYDMFIIRYLILLICMILAVWKRNQLMSFFKAIKKK
ncbi:MAG: oligosaccharide flippase family protein [Ruminococcus sp.]|nr:oligosaccharide flippase family protein [Ruminococcus sp.]